MSFSFSFPGDAAAAAEEEYFCYQCNRTVRITQSPTNSSTDLSCPICHDGFLELYQNPNPNPSPFDLLFPITQSAAPRSDSPDQFNPIAFLQNYLNALQSGAAGANFQFVVGDGDSNFNFLDGASLGDYFVGPSLENLIQQLAENDPNRYGTPPASKAAVEALPDVAITKEMMDCDSSSQCAVCRENFEVGEAAKELPCKHLYHGECILPWLELHNSCPVCRFELPTEDVDYENRERDGAGQSTGRGIAAVAMGDAGVRGGDSGRTVERRFTIQLPWPFRTSGEGSNSSSRRDSSAGGGSKSGSDAREEDLY